jgi:hypothetical protein
MFSNTLNVCSSFDVRDHISHPYKTTGKNIDFVCFNLMCSQAVAPQNHHTVLFHIPNLCINKTKRSDGASNLTLATLPTVHENTVEVGNSPADLQSEAVTPRFIQTWELGCWFYHNERNFIRAGSGKR